jgi:hypothetical protein
VVRRSLTRFCLVARPLMQPTRTLLRHLSLISVAQALIRVVNGRIDKGSFEVQAATPTPACRVTSPLCGLTIIIPPTDFQINLSDPVDPSSVQASDLTVNGIPADSAVVTNGNRTIDFIFNLSPALTVNTIHISAGALTAARLSTSTALSFLS